VDVRLVTGTEADTQRPSVPDRHAHTPEHLFAVAFIGMTDHIVACLQV
jgi:hypothetical protein